MCMKLQKKFPALDPLGFTLLAALAGCGAPEATEQIAFQAKAQGTSCARLEIDLDGDADRDGDIDNDDERGEDTWAMTYGVLVLPNLDDDGNRCAATETVNDVESERVILD